MALLDYFRRETRSQTSSKSEPSWHALASGNMPNAQGAENLATVMACVGAISSALASLPVYVYRKQGGGKVEDPTHPVAKLVERGPNDTQSWPEFVEWFTASALLQGNALAEIVTDQRGAPVELIPHPWNRVNVRVLDNGRLLYEVTDQQGRTRRLLQSEVWHLRDRTDDGMVGVSRLKRARNVIEAGEQVQRLGINTYRNGVFPSGVVMADEAIGADQIEKLSQRFREAFGGTNNAGTALVLDQGLQWKQLGVSPEDAELLASRRFSVEELARIFQVPPPIVGDYTHNTFTNSQTAGRWFATHTLTPWITKLEAGARRSIFSTSSRMTHSMEFDLSGFLRGDPEQRWNAHKIAIETGVLDTDEVRQIEGFNARRAETRSLDTLTPAQRRSLERRLEIRARYEPQLVEALQPIVEQDAAAVLDALENDAVDELDWSEYGGDDGLVASAVVPIALNMERDVRGAIEDETGTTVDNAEPFTRALAGSMGTAYAAASRKQVETLRPEALRERVADWQESRARDLAVKGTVRIESGTAHRLYRKAGQEQVTVVDANGRNETGRLSEPFTSAGDDIGGVEASTDLYNPPLNVGDDRVIVGGP